MPFSFVWHRLKPEAQDNVIGTTALFCWRVHRSAASRRDGGTHLTTAVQRRESPNFAGKTMSSRLSLISGLGQPIVLGLGFAILVTISGLSVWLVAQTRADAQKVIWTIDLIERLSDLRTAVRRTESEQRSFLSTGDPGRRDAFRAEADAARLALARVKAAFVGNTGEANQGKLVADLDAAVTRELAHLEMTADRRDHNGLEAFSSNDVVVRTTSDKIRNVIAQLEGQEQRLLAEQIRVSQNASRLLLVASLLGVALIVVLAVISVTMVRRSTRQLKSAHRKLEEINESLEATVASRTAELRIKNAEIQNFAHIVSHDLRSPLVNVMGFTSELEAVRRDLFDRLSSLRERLNDDPEQDRKLGQDFEQALKVIKNSIRRMDRLIKAILKLTREGRRELRMETIDMTELVRSTADSLGYQANEVGASIAIEQLPPLVGDRLAVEQIFANLLENALKYLRDDTPGRIRVTGRSTATEFIFEVQDNGRGIDAKDSERIFEIFRRAGRQDRPGEGIGLTYVRTLVRRLGGNIAVHSTLGQGSTFRVILPRHATGGVKEINP